MHAAPALIYNGQEAIRNLKEFTYASMKAAFISDEVRASNYHRAVPDRVGFSDDVYGYMHLRRPRVAKVEERPSKIHVSLTQTEGNIAKAWDSLLPIMMQHGIVSSKAFIMDETHQGQKGKQIVFYIRNEPGVNLETYWPAFLRDADKALSAAKAIPGERPVLRYIDESSESAERARHTEPSRLEHKIGGSAFFYYAEELPRGSAAPVVPSYLAAPISTSIAFFSAGLRRAFADKDKGLGLYPNK